MVSTKDNRLGRGLDALVSPAGLDKLLSPELPERNNPKAGQPLLVSVELLDSNPDQPRHYFNEKELLSLGQSIKAKGIIEPLVVSKKEGGRFEIIAGERRLKAAKLVNLNQVPVIIREISDENSDRLVLALLENLCREDLNPIEEAESFQRLEKDFGKTHQEIATMTGRERPTITNTVRLLKLPDFVRDDIRFGRISAGHGRAMLSLMDQSLFHQLRTEVMGRQMTVRQTEALVRKMNRKPLPGKGDVGDEAYFETLARSFADQLGGLKVKISHGAKTKKMEIYYSNNEELEWLMKKMGVTPQ